MLLMSLFTTGSFAQGTLRGHVIDEVTGEELVGANVALKGTSFGTSTDITGSFSLAAPAGSYDVVISFIGYEEKEFTATVVEGRTTRLGDLGIRTGAFELSELELVASRYDEKTPFAATNVAKRDVQLRLASRDIPNVLNTAPNVYSTNSGGGFGDSRINMRGFNQRNIAIMINGVPVNDMENGWVYWSNWSGIGDATSNIQVQRGLSAVNLATPSIGGTINIITDPAAQQAGAVVQQEYGSFNMRKTTATFHTGDLDGFAMSGTFVRHTQDGFSEGTWADAYSYYIGASYKFSDKDKLEFFAMGAPQRHGQNLYRQNIARYDKEYALSLDGYDPAAAEEYDQYGRTFNQNYTGVEEDYSGLQYYDMYGTKHDLRRYDQNSIMERENFFHKPQVSLNWYHNFSDKVRWTNVAYWSGGRGGGTGTFGSVSSLPPTFRRDWNSEIEQNMNNIDSVIDPNLNRSTGILRNSRNNQWTVGLLSKMFVEVSDKFDLVVGIDARTAKIEHYREVRDLLGGDYYYYTGNEFETTDAQYMKGLGDKIDKHNSNTVSWIGGYAQGAWDFGALNLNAMAGFTSIGYSFEDYFNADDNGDFRVSEAKSLPGYQVKGGALYALNENFSVFGNAGYVSKNPIFDAAISDRTGQVYPNPENEKFLSFEVGGRWTSNNGKLGVNGTYYNTTWNDRTLVQGVTEQDGTDNFIYITGMNANHQGVEFEIGYQPTRKWRFDAVASFNNWVLTDDVTGTYTERDPDTGDIVEIDYGYFVKDLKVGDSPQTSFSLIANWKPIRTLNFQAVARQYMNNYSDWNPFDRTDETDRTQSWKAPDYFVIDLHANWTVFQGDDVTLDVFGHVFNATDAIYVQDATDNSRFNSFDGDHDADDAEVFLGLPRNFNAGFRVRFN